MCDEVLMEMQFSRISCAGCILDFAFCIFLIWFGLKRFAYFLFGIFFFFSSLKARKLFDEQNRSKLSSRNSNLHPKAPKFLNDSCYLPYTKLC